MIRCAACKKKFTDNVAFEQHSCVKELEKLSTEELLRQYREARKENIASQFHEYMQFRAKKEGVEYNLDKSFFLGGLACGVADFFGISYDDNGLVADRQQPELFAKWRKLNRTKGV